MKKDFSSKQPSHRQLRVGEEIRHILAAILTRGDLPDPAFESLHLTISEVRISPDFRNATIFVMPLGGESRDEAMALLKQYAPYLRHLLSKRMTLRHVPALKFVLDSSFDYAQKIDTLIKSVTPATFTHVVMPSKTLVGISCRTSNAREFNPETAQIAGMVNRYVQENIAQLLTQRVLPGTTYAVYTDYENGVAGDYTYFLGEEVKDAASVPEGLSRLVIPEQRYIKATTEPGVMPAVCIEMWQRLWHFSPEELGGERAYVADFEVYDERAHDLQQAVLDIYIGLKA